MLYLADDIKSVFKNTADTIIFEQLMSLKGKCFRAHKNRETHQVKINDTFYFIKQHQPIGIKEIIKNLLQFKWPVCSAKNEWRAILKLQQLNIAVPELKAYGAMRSSSFVLLQALTDTISLEELAHLWQSSVVDWQLKRKLIEHVARIAKIMHTNGVSHRDFYLCHFLMPKSALIKLSDVKLYVIDLHRAQIHHQLSKRALLKDLAGLYFSSKEIKLHAHDYLRFIKFYTDAPLRTVLMEQKNLWRRVKNRGERLYRKHV